MKIVPATDSKHKYTAIFDDGKKTSFGAKGYTDYLQSGDKVLRERYRKRHHKDLETNDPRRAGYLSYYLLWGDSTNLQTNIAAYKRRFNV
jgi:hypothetical protein